MTATRLPVHAWRDQQLSPLVLGTAQLGLRYGIANDSGQPSRDVATAMVAAAWQHGLRTFDTAQAYGDSESVLGEAVARNGGGAQAVICTKLSPDLAPLDAAAIGQALAASRRRLRQETIWGVMLHRPQWLGQWHLGLGDTLRSLRDAGRLRHLGVSVYTVTEARTALANPDIDFIQVPFNAWDQRMLEQQVFARARELDKLCFIRSIYLQGLLLLSAAPVAVKLPAAAPAAQAWQQCAEQMSLPPDALAMATAKAMCQPIIFGAESIAQIDANVRLFQDVQPLSEDALCELRNRLQPVLSPEILNPSCWS